MKDYLSLIPEEAKSAFRDVDRRKFAAIEWDEEDWRILYHCLGFAIWLILRRKRKLKEEVVVSEFSRIK